MLTKKHVILEACHVSSIAYRPVKLLSPSAKHIAALPCQSNPEALLYNASPHLHVTFRGTYNLNDLAYIVDVRHKRLKDRHHVHQGFLRKYKSLETRLQHAIDAAIAQDPSLRELVFSGHSMGGSLAMIAAYHFLETHPHLSIACHTFGAPMTANAPFHKYLTSNTDHLLCVKMKKDIVPYIPLNPHFFHQENNFYLDPHNNERIPLWDILRNHSCTTYYTALNQSSLTPP